MNNNLIQSILLRNPIKINTKSEFYALHDIEILWNRTRTWDSYEEILSSDWKGLICMRARNAGTRNRPVYNIQLKDIKSMIEEWKKQGIKEHEIKFNESMPDDKLVVQGEVICDSHEGLISWSSLDLRYSTVKKPMLQALAEESHYAEGLTAKTILETCLWPADWQELKFLFNLFPNNVIEFSAYSYPVGKIPGRNMVIWEVRNY